MLVLKGYLLTIPADSEGGVGGLLCWKIMFGMRHTTPKINSTNMRLNVCVLPTDLSSSESRSYLPKTIPGMKIPMTSDTLRTRVSSCVTDALFSAENQFADILAWQFRMKGLPTPAITWPIMTHTKDSLTSILIAEPTSPSAHPIAKEARVPYVSITYAAGKVNTGYMSAKSKTPELITNGSC